MDNVKLLKLATKKLIENKIRQAAELIVNKYQFKPIKKVARKCTINKMMQVFFRDGFIGRYSGDKLVNPAILRVISEKLPKEFPYQAHWKMSECHIAYYELMPTLDHIYPIALGGKDEIDNWQLHQCFII